jgi:hypothetical protein
MDDVEAGPGVVLSVLKALGRVEVAMTATGVVEDLGSRRRPQRGGLSVRFSSGLGRKDPDGLLQLWGKRENRVVVDR